MATESEIKRELRRAGIMRSSKQVYVYLSSYNAQALHPKIKKAQKNMVMSRRVTLKVEDFAFKPKF